MIIDSHVHIDGWNGEKLVAMDPVVKLNQLLREMKTGGVDHAVILASYHRRRADHPNTAEVLKAVGNEKCVSVVGSVDVLSLTKKDLTELDHYLSERKIVGIKLYPGYQHFFPSDVACEPIYRLCLKHDVPVIFHSGDTLSGLGVASKVKYSHPLNIDEVAADHPKLKIIIAHVGNPWLTDCAEILYKNENVYADISGFFLDGSSACPDSPYGELMRRRLKDLIAYCSPRKLLFGTDWSLSNMKDYLKFVRSLGLGKKDLEYALYRNAQILFKIGVSQNRPLAKKTGLR